LHGRQAPGNVSVWIEANVRLPAGIAAEPGPIKLYRRRGFRTVTTVIGATAP
jgi:hypothetical protein